MKVKGLDGREYKLALAGKVVGARDARGRSAGHLEARRLLLALFPFDPPYEEVTVPGCGAALYLDFLLPQRRLAVEVQGAQHRRESRHFHGGKAGFAAQRRRDQAKREWAEANDITLLELHDDDRGSWEERLRSAPGLARPAGGEAGPVGGGGGDAGV